MIRRFLYEFYMSSLTLHKAVEIEKALVNRFQAWGIEEVEAVQFEPQGVSISLVCSDMECHLHLWNEYNYMTIDVYTNPPSEPMCVIDSIVTNLARDIGHVDFFMCRAIIPAERTEHSYLQYETFSSEYQLLCPCQIPCTNIHRLTHN